MGYDTCPLSDNNVTRLTSPDFLAHVCKCVYTCRVTVCECMHTCWHMLPTCSYPWVNLRRYEYRSPEVYLLENPYPLCGYGFFGRLGTGMAPDTCRLPVLLPSSASQWVVRMAMWCKGCKQVESPRKETIPNTILNLLQALARLLVRSIKLCHHVSQGSSTDTHHPGVGHCSPPFHCYCSPPPLFSAAAPTTLLSCQLHSAYQLWRTRQISWINLLSPLTVSLSIIALDSENNPYLIWSSSCWHLLCKHPARACRLSCGCNPASCTVP